MHIVKRSARSPRNCQFFYRLSIGLLLIVSANRPADAADAALESTAPYPMQPGTHEVVIDSNVMISMRDDVRLATDLYRPAGASLPLPSILIRTPYSKLRKDAGVEWARFFASHGYVVAVQDVRGKFNSKGVFSVTGSDAADGFDTIGWLAAQRWSNGRVGTFGCSYLGLNQVMTATLRPPALKAMIASAAGGALGDLGGRASYFGAHRGGAFELAASMQWFPVAAGKHPIGDASSSGSPARPAVDIMTHGWALPIGDILPRAGVADTDWTEFATRSPRDPAWRSLGYIGDDARADVPTLWVNSWYDYGVAETLALRDHFARTSLSAAARENQPVILSPAEHCQSEKLTKGAVVQGRPMGDARFDYWSAYLDWFDRWLRPSAQAASPPPAFRYFIMGRNHWQTSAKWPSAHLRPSTLYLASQRGANSRFGDGSLSIKTGSARQDVYVYDPATPVPSVGGPFCCRGFPSSGSEDPYDHRAVEARNDVLVYTSPPLAAELEVSGPVTLHLAVTSDAADTDFTAKLLVVEESGRSIGLLETILRAQYREGFATPLPIVRGKPNMIRLELGETSNVFRRGERIRVEISSSNFPRFDRNANPEKLKNAASTVLRPATNRVYLGGSSGTRLDLWSDQSPKFAAR